MRGTIADGINERGKTITTSRRRRPTEAEIDEAGDGCFRILVEALQIGMTTPVNAVVGLTGSSGVSNPSAIAAVAANTIMYRVDPPPGSGYGSRSTIAVIAAEFDEITVAINAILQRGLSNFTPEASSQVRKEIEASIGSGKEAIILSCTQRSSKRTLPPPPPPPPDTALEEDHFDEEVAQPVSKLARMGGKGTVGSRPTAADTGGWGIPEEISEKVNGASPENDLRDLRSYERDALSDSSGSDGEDGSGRVHDLIDSARDSSRRTGAPPRARCLSYCLYETTPVQRFVPCDDLSDILALAVAELTALSPTQGMGMDQALTDLLQGIIISSSRVILATVDAVISDSWNETAVQGAPLPGIVQRSVNMSMLEVPIRESIDEAVAEKVSGGVKTLLEIQCDGITASPGSETLPSATCVFSGATIDEGDPRIDIDIINREHGVQIGEGSKVTLHGGNHVYVNRVCASLGMADSANFVAAVSMLHCWPEVFIEAGIGMAMHSHASDNRTSISAFKEGMGDRAHKLIIAKRAAQIVSIMAGVMG